MKKQTKVGHGKRKPSAAKDLTSRPVMGGTTGHSLGLNVGMGDGSVRLLNTAVKN
jgi:prepilin-type processing-associated H-X9-DG protein